ncbi:MAG: hydrogenase maturation nickel metallochaperone HypA [Clostridiales bacterium]
MHEFPITQQIIKLAEKHAKENGASAVTKVNLVVGLYSGFIGECIQMYFDVIAEGTLCENATIEIKAVKPKLKCSKCGELFERQPMSFKCPYCDGEGEPTKIGKEFYIDSIEIEA